MLTIHGHPSIHPWTLTIHPSIHPSRSSSSQPVINPNTHLPVSAQVDLTRVDVTDKRSGTRLSPLSCQPSPASQPSHGWVSSLSQLAGRYPPACPTFYLLYLAHHHPTPPPSFPLSTHPRSNHNEPKARSLAHCQARLDSSNCGKRKEAQAVLGPPGQDPIIRAAPFRLWNATCPAPQCRPSRCLRTSARASRTSAVLVVWPALALSTFLRRACPPKPITSSLSRHGTAPTQLRVCHPLLPPWMHSGIR